MTPTSNFFYSLGNYTETIISHPITQFTFQTVIEVIKIAATAKFLDIISRQLQIRTLNSTNWKAPVIFITVIGPVMEEIIFRGAVLRGIHLCQKAWNHCILKREPTNQEKRTQQFVRIQLSSLLFAAVHLRNPYSKAILAVQFIGTYMMGNVYAYLSEKYQTLSASILSHGIHNTCVVALEFYPEFVSLFTLATIVNDISSLILADLCFCSFKSAKNQAPLDHSVFDNPEHIEIAVQ